MYSVCSVVEQSIGGRFCNWLNLNEAVVLEVARRIADKKFAFGLTAAGPCLAAPFRVFDAYCAENAQIRKNLRVNYPFPVALNFHLTFFLMGKVSSFGVGANPIRSDFVFSFGQIRKGCKVCFFASPNQIRFQTARFTDASAYSTAEPAMLMRTWTTPFDTVVFKSPRRKASPHSQGS